MKEFTRSCSHILNLICFVLHLLLFSFQRSIPLRSILHSPSGESPCRSVPSLCDSLYIIPHFLSLVKGFSKSFLKFFPKVFRKASETVSFSHWLASGWYFLHPHFQALDYYTTFCSVCQEVFRKFFEVFSLAFVFDKPLRIRFVHFPSRPTSRGLSQVPRFERLIIIPLFASVVKPFSQISFVFCMIISFPAKTTRMRG